MAEIEGFRDLNKKFSKLMAVATQKQLETALVSGALLIANKAKSNAHVITSTMRRSIHIGGHTEKTPDFKAGEGYSDLGSVPSGKNSVVVKIGSNLKYAAVEEFRGGSHAYLRPAADSEADAARLEVAKALEILILKAAG